MTGTTSRLFLVLTNLTLPQLNEKFGETEAQSSQVVGVRGRKDLRDKPGREEPRSPHS